MLKFARETKENKINKVIKIIHDFKNIIKFCCKKGVLYRK